MSSLKIGERMNIYVKNTKYRNLKTLVKRCVLKLPKEPIDLHIYSSRRTSLLALVFLVLNCSSIRSIELMQDISTLSLPIVLFANAKNSFKLQLLVSKPITKRHWKKCKLLNGVVNILDTSSCDHTPLYAQNRNIISLNPLHDGICEANIYLAAVRSERRNRKARHTDHGERQAKNRFQFSSHYFLPPFHWK